MASARRSALAAVGGILVLNWMVAACSGSGGETGAVGTAGEGGTAIVVQSSSLYVTVENRSGAPLLDLRVAINPAGVMTFTKTIGRLEAGEKRDLALGEFSARDGTTFNLRVVRPKMIGVTAADLLGKKYEVTTPWR